MTPSLVAVMDAPSLANPFGRAESDDGKRLSQQILDALGAGPDDRSVSMGQRFRELDQIAARTASGEGDPVPMSAVNLAKDFLALLPRTYPVPEVLADTDGDVLIEWRSARDYIVTVSVSGDGQIHFAGLFGGQSVYGTEKSLGDSVPRPIAMCLQSLNAAKVAGRG